MRLNQFVLQEVLDQSKHLDDGQIESDSHETFPFPAIDVSSYNFLTAIKAAKGTENNRLRLNAMTLFAFRVSDYLRIHQSTHLEQEDNFTSAFTSKETQQRDHQWDQHEISEKDENRQKTPHSARSSDAGDAQWENDVYLNLAYLGSDSEGEQPQRSPQSFETSQSDHRQQSPESGQMH